MDHYEDMRKEFCVHWRNVPTNFVQTSNISFPYNFSLWSGVGSSYILDQINTVLNLPTIFYSCITLTWTRTAEWQSASFSVNTMFETGSTPGSCPQVVTRSLS